MMKWFGVSIIFIALMLAGCNNSGSLDPLAKYRGFSAKQLYMKGESALARGDYSGAAKFFEALDANYPFGQYNQRADLDSIYAYYMNADTPQTLAAADRYIHLYPQSNDVDYAYYMRGLANYNEYRGFFSRLFHYDLSKRDMSSVKDAYRDFLTLVTLFPRSHYAPDARQHLIFIRNLLAKHDLEVAQFYLKRQAYVAAVNRATEVVTKFPRSEYVPQALAVMVKANQQLNLAGPANDALRVLRKNFPQSPLLAHLQA